MLDGHQHGISTVLPTNHHCPTPSQSTADNQIVLLETLLHARLKSFLLSVLRPSSTSTARLISRKITGGSRTGFGITNLVPTRFNSH